MRSTWPRETQSGQTLQHQNRTHRQATTYLTWLKNLYGWRAELLSQSQAPTLNVYLYLSHGWIN